MRAPLLFRAVALLPVFAASGQDRPYTLSVQVEEVRLSLSAADFDGRPIDDLRQQDVRISDSGKPPKQITSFRHFHDLPLRAGLLVDTSPSSVWGSAFPQGRWVAEFFTTRLFHSREDFAFVASVDSEYRIKQEWSDDSNRVREGIRNVARDARSRLGGTSIYDALYRACRDQFESKDDEEGRFSRVIFLFSDGRDNASHALPSDVARMCQRSGTVILIFMGDPHSHFDKGQKAMQNLATLSGGQVFYGDNREALAADLTHAQILLRSRYVVGYRPQAFKRDGSFHRLKVDSPSRGGVIVTRSGYYALPQ